MTNVPKFRIAAGVALLLASTPALADPQAFDTPEAAVSAMVAAVEAKDRAALIAIFGPGNEDVVLTGDDAEDREAWGNFLEGYRQAHRIEMESPERAVLYLGSDDWPFPAALVGADGAWTFDGPGARDEVLARRIGLNELDVVDLLRAGVGAQARYRQVDHDGDGVMEFAASIISAPGERDGLFWPDEPGTEKSPIGEFMARASADGFAIDQQDQEPEPYLGYYFRILLSQGPDAPGGAYDYKINGNMVASFAYLAFPAAYGDTGVMTFLVGENGVVYEQDLGEDTLNLAHAITTFDPGEGWAPFEDVD